MNNNRDKPKGLPGMDVLETSAWIFKKHGKSEKEIREFLEENFPISSAIVQRVIEAIKNRI